MTTIAFDGATLCTDSQAIGQYVEPHDFQKITKLIDHKGQPGALAFAGTLGFMPLLVEWVKTGIRPEFPSNCKDSVGLFVQTNGELKEYATYSPCPVDVKAPYAEGTGGRYAIAAMLAGATAYRATEIAILLDEDSGRGIQAYNPLIDELLGPFAK